MQEASYDFSYESEDKKINIVDTEWKYLKNFNENYVDDQLTKAA